MVFSGGGRPPPTATTPLPGPMGRPPNRGPRRQALILLIVLLLGMGFGFAGSQLFGGGEDNVPDEDLVLYESASTSFPVEGAEFTRSTFDVQKGKCDKTILKQSLRDDARRVQRVARPSGDRGGRVRRVRRPSPDADPRRADAGDELRLLPGRRRAVSVRDPVGARQGDAGLVRPEGTADRREVHVLEPDPLAAVSAELRGDPDTEPVADADRRHRRRPAARRRRCRRGRRPRRRRRHRRPDRRRHRRRSPTVPPSTTSPRRAASRPSSTRRAACA